MGTGPLEAEKESSAWGMEPACSPSVGPFPTPWESLGSWNP